jgi:hypothetical protein
MRLIVFFDMEGIVHYQYVPQGQTVNQQFYYKFWNVWDFLFLARGHGNGWRGAGRCLTTTHQRRQHIPSGYFWQVMAFLSFSNHPTPLTWLRVTFGCFPNQKQCWKGTDLKTLTKLRRIWRVRWTPFQKTLSKYVSTGGRTAGTSVSAHKESILKIIKKF